MKHVKKMQGLKKFLSRTIATRLQAKYDEVSYALRLNRLRARYAHYGLDFWAMGLPTAVTITEAMKQKYGYRGPGSLHDPASAKQALALAGIQGELAKWTGLIYITLDADRPYLRWCRKHHWQKPSRMYACLARGERTSWTVPKPVLTHMAIGDGDRVLKKIRYNATLPLRGPDETTFYDAQKLQPLQMAARGILGADGRFTPTSYDLVRQTSTQDFGWFDEPPVDKPSMT